MVELVLGIAAAIGASTLYSLGVALQALDARQTPHDEYLRVGLARNLLKRRRWLLGTGLSLLGWPLQLLALSLAPLVVVQPSMAAGLLVLLLVGERLLGERAGRREHLAVSAIVLGVIGAALCAPPNTTTQSPDDVIAIVLCVLGLASLLPYLILRLGRRPPAAIAMGAAGLAYGWSGVATKLASDNLAYGFLLIALAWGVATAAASAVAALSEMSALQSRPAIQVAPVVFVIQTAIPVALAPILFGERFTDTPLSGAALATSLAVLIAGAAVLARSPLLVALLEGESAAAERKLQPELVSDASGSAESRLPRSAEATRSTPPTEASDPATVTTSTSPSRTWR
jgi:drug/metabolite transporter (DMT)-like permease